MKRFDKDQDDHISVDEFESEMLPKKTLIWKMKKQYNLDYNIVKISNQLFFPRIKNF